MTDQGNPAGYEELAVGTWRIVVRSACRDGLREAGIANPHELARRGTVRFQGRGRPVRVTLPDGTRGVLRRYLHGGLLRRLTGGLFLGRPRPLDEFRALLRAKDAGVKVPEVLAVLWRSRFLLFHEGYLMTREVADSLDLVEAVAQGRTPGPLLQAVGRETRRMHDAGIWHADLHVKNVLCVDGAAMLLDFDGARIPGTLTRRDRFGNLIRFDRSVEKLVRGGARISRTDRGRFAAGYFGGNLEGEDRQRLVAACRRNRWWHRLWWRLTGK